MKNILIILALVVSTMGNAQGQLPFELEKDWELVGFENPESAVLDAANKVLYVSNVNGAPGDKDGNGYISKVSLDGKIIEQKWVVGLNAPKGLVIFEGNLFVTDIDEIAEIDIKSKKVKIHKAPEATFLNDITVDKMGNVFASNTFGFSVIYKIASKGATGVELWLKDEKLNMPNGLYVSGGELYTAGWGIDMNPENYVTKTPGNLQAVDLKTKAISDVSNPIGNLDGLSETIHGFLMTDWLAGKLLYYSNETKTTTEVLTLAQGSADIYFDKETKSLFIPMMMDNKLLNYHFKK